MIEGIFQILDFKLLIFKIKISLLKLSYVLKYPRINIFRQPKIFFGSTWEVRFLLVLLGTWTKKHSRRETRDERRFADGTCRAPSYHLLKNTQQLYHKKMFRLPTFTKHTNKKIKDFGSLKT